MRLATLCAATLLAFGTAGPAAAIDYLWNSGSYGANGLPNPLPLGDVVTAQGTGVKSFAAHTTIQGTLRWSSPARIDLYSPYDLRIEGLLDVTVDGSRFTYGGGSTLDLVGRLLKSAGEGSFEVSAPFTARSGATLDAASGVLRYTVGGQIQDGVVFQGAGRHVFAGTNAPSSTFGFGARLLGPSAQVEFASGLFQSTAAGGTLLDTDLAWTGGTLFGDWVLPAERTLTARAGVAKQIADGLSIEGRMVWTSGEDLIFSAGGAQLSNRGVLEFQADTRLRAVNTGALENAGRLTKTGGAGNLVFDVPVFNRAGAVLDAAQGTLRYRNGGQFDAGSSFAGAGGTHVFEGLAAGSAAFGFAGALAAPLDNVRFASGLFYNTGNAPLVLETDLAFVGGSLGGGWRNPAGRTMSVLPGSAKSITQVFTNEGRLQFGTTEALVLSGSSRLDNSGTLDFMADGLLSANNVGSVINTGVVRKSAGLGTAWISAPLVNRGVVEVLAGTLRVQDAWTNDGELRGTATLRSNRVNNLGTIAPGLTGGPLQLATLTLDGSLVNGAGGVLAFDLARGGASDLLIVAGAMGFDGWLQVSSHAGYQAALGDRFLLLTFASASGTLDGVRSSGFAPGVLFRPVYEAQALWLEVSAVPEPGAGALLLAGLGWMLWTVRGRARAPRAR